MKTNVDKTMTLRISASDKKRLKELAAVNDRTMQQEIRRAIRLYLEGK
jgi:predicted transcriptional regulator